MRAVITLPEFPEAEALMAGLDTLAVEAVRRQMESGYASPVRRSGALERDVRARIEGKVLSVGCTLPYAAVIHAKRPFLADGLKAAAEEWIGGMNG